MFLLKRLYWTARPRADWTDFDRELNRIDWRAEISHSRIMLEIWYDRRRSRWGRFRMRIQPSYRSRFKVWIDELWKEAYRRGKRNEDGRLPDHLPNIFWEDGFLRPPTERKAHQWIREFQKGLTSVEALNDRGFFAWGENPTHFG